MSSVRRPQTRVQFTGCLEAEEEEEEQEQEEEEEKRRRRRRKVYSGANAVNEEDPERDRATQV